MNATWEPLAMDQQSGDVAAAHCCLCGQLMSNEGGSFHSACADRENFLADARGGGTLVETANPQVIHACPPQRVHAA